MQLMNHHLSLEMRLNLSIKLKKVIQFLYLPYSNLKFVKFTNIFTLRTEFNINFFTIYDNFNFVTIILD